MELKLAVLFGLYCILFIQIAESIIVPNADENKFDGLKKDIPVASGASPDDEDGDVDEGSGSTEDQFEGSGAGIVKGNININSNSNSFNINNITLITPSTLHTTTTPFINEAVGIGNKKPPEEIHPRRPADNDYGGKNYGHEDREEESRNFSESPSRPNEDHVLIEDSSTARTIPAFKTLPTVRTTPSATPSMPETADNNRIYFGTLFKPGILAAVIGGFVVGILAAILLVMFIVYRMRKKDEGSYALDEQKQPPMYPYAYQKASTKEFYA